MTKIYLLVVLREGIAAAVSVAIFVKDCFTVLSITWAGNELNVKLNHFENRL